MTEPAEGFEYRLVVTLTAEASVVVADVEGEWVSPTGSELETLHTMCMDAAATPPVGSGFVSLDTEDGSWWCIPARSVGAYRVEVRVAKPPEQKRAAALGVAEE